MIIYYIHLTRRIDLDYKSPGQQTILVEDKGVDSNYFTLGRVII